MRVDDIMFSKFVSNDLPQAKMIEIEKMLIEDGEINASIHASILNHSINKEYADDLLGTDEKNINKEYIYSSTGDSKDLNNESLNLNIKAMNCKLTKEEILKVQNLVGKFNESFNSDLSFEENLVKFYMLQRPGVLTEDALNAVNGLKSGIISFNDKLKKALEDGDFDYAVELKNITAEMPLKEKYELYINFLAALQTLCVNNLSMEQLSQLEDFQTIRERLTVQAEVTEEMVAEAEEKISKMLKNNNLCLGSVEELKELVQELPKGAESVGMRVKNADQDFRQKMVIATATYIAYQNEELESLNGKELTPEAVAIFVAAGVEEMKVLNDLNSGNTTADKAIKVLKVIGGIALFALLACIAVNFVLAVGVVAFATLISIFGSSTVVAIAAAIFSMLAVAVACESTFDACEKVMGWSSRVFDLVIKTWRETLWPAVYGALSDVGNWFRSLFQNSVISQEQQNENNVQTVS